jgi:uncharacterized protein (DUF2062 family)
MLERKLSGTFAAWTKSEERKAFLERLRRRRSDRLHKHLPAWMLRVSRWMPDAAAVGKTWIGRALGKSVAKPECWSFKPHNAALGLGIGMFMCWTPTPGVQMAITAVLCCIAGGNVPLGILGTWFSNPVFLLAEIYAGFWILGLGWPSLPPDATMLQIGEIAFKEFYVPTAVGSIILGIPSGILTYFAAYGFAHWQRRHHFMSTLKERAKVRRERWKKGADERRALRAENRLRRHARSVAHKAAKTAARASSAMMSQPLLPPSE